jgi:hypothetical protein
MPLIYAVGIAVVAQLLIYSGLTFMVGKLLPTLLTPVYDVVPAGNYRFLVSSATVILAGNYLFQRLYSWQPVLNAGIISVVTGVHSKHRRFDYRTQIPQHFNGDRIDTRDYWSNYYCLC